MKIDDLDSKLSLSDMYATSGMIPIDLKQKISWVQYTTNLFLVSVFKTQIE